jgi:hypothetical protein
VLGKDEVGVAENPVVAILLAQRSLHTVETGESDGQNAATDALWFSFKIRVGLAFGSYRMQVKRIYLFQRGEPFCVMQGFYDQTNQCIGNGIRR